MPKEKSRATKQEESDAVTKLSDAIRKMMETDVPDILACEGVANPLRELFLYLHHSERYTVGQGWNLIRIDTFESNGKIKTVAFITADKVGSHLVVECFKKGGAKIERKWKLDPNLGPEVVKFLRKHLPKQ